MEPLRVVVVDDDEWKRRAMADRLDATDEFKVVGATDQDAAVLWAREEWAGVDAAVIDVFDDRAPGEVGTDMYSGIMVVDRLRDLSIRSIAVTPSCAHPLVQLRLAQARPGYVYHRYQLANFEQLSEAIRFPARDRKVPEPDPELIRDFGARNLRANDVVRAYLVSPLKGLLQRDLGHKELKRAGLPRSAIDNLKSTVARLGYQVAESNRASGRIDATGGDPKLEPRWPEVRDLLLTLLGRQDFPPSEYDQPWWG